MDTSIPEFLAEAANRRVSDIFIIAGRPLAEKIDGHLLDRGDRLMPDQTENLLRTIYGLAENRDISRLMETGDDDFSFSIPGVSRFRVNAYKQRGSLAAVIRVIAFRLPDPAELSIPEDVMNIRIYPWHGPCYRFCRKRQIHHHGLSDRPDQPYPGRPHHHSGGSSGISPPP